jgi:putative peptidoglycan lipid II flippase
MHRKIMSALNRELVNVNHAAFFLGLFAMFAQVLGLMRDRALVSMIGPGATLDTYYAAFRAPDLIYIIFGSVVSVVVIMPFISKVLSDDEKEKKVLGEKGKTFISSVYSAFLIVIVLVAVLGIIFMPFIARLVAPGFAGLERAQLISVGRIMFLSPIFLGLSNLFGSITQTFKRFFIFALSPVFYNIGILLGILVFYPHFGLDGLVYGVILGAFLHFAIQWLSVRSHNSLPRLLFKSIDWKLMKSIVVSSIPRTIGLVLNNLTIVVLLAIASFFTEGTISIFNFSFNIQSLTLSVIGLSYAMAAFPTLTEYFNSGNREQFFNYLETVIRQIIFWTLPTAVLFIVLRAQIVRVLLGSHSFSWADTRLTAAALACFALSVPAQSLISLLMRAYYGAGKTKRPLYLGLISVIITTLCAGILSYLFLHTASFRNFFESTIRVEGVAGTEVMILALAYSLGTNINAILLWRYLKRDFKYFAEFRSLERAVLQHMVASVIIGFGAYFSLNIFSMITTPYTFLGIFTQGFLAGIVGIICGACFLYGIKNKELRGIIDSVKTAWEKRFPSPIEHHTGERLDF